MLAVRPRDQYPSANDDRFVHRRVQRRSSSKSIRAGQEGLNMDTPGGRVAGRADGRHSLTTAIWLALAVATALGLVLALASVERTHAQEDNASLLIRKVDENGNRLADAIFEIEGMEGQFTTDEEGEFCLTGLPNDSVWAVTEVQAPPGFEPADPATQMVEVDDDGDCDSPDAVFVNTVAQAQVGSLLILKTNTTGGGLADAIFEIEGVTDPITTPANGVICLDNLTLGDVITVTETQAPAGFILATPATREVTVTRTTTCAERDATDADETFVNPLQQVSVGQPTPRQQVRGGVPTPRGRAVPDTAMPAETAPLAGVLGVVLVVSLAGVAALSYRRVRSDD
jgi:hypothetical protein